MSHEIKKPTRLKKCYFSLKSRRGRHNVRVYYFIAYLGTTDLDATGRRVSLQQKQQQQQQQ